MHAPRSSGAARSARRTAVSSQVWRRSVRRTRAAQLGGDPLGLLQHRPGRRATWTNIAAVVIGRRLFDLTNGWGGRPAIGEAVFVVTHQEPADWLYPDAPYTFVTDGLESAITQAKTSSGS